MIVATTGVLASTILATAVDRTVAVAIEERGREIGVAIGVAKGRVRRAIDITMIAIEIRVAIEVARETAIGEPKSCSIYVAICTRVYSDSSVTQLVISLSVIDASNGFVAEVL